MHFETVALQNTCIPRHSHFKTHALQDPRTLRHLHSETLALRDTRTTRQSHSETLAHLDIRTPRDSHSKTLAFRDTRTPRYSHPETLALPDTRTKTHSHSETLAAATSHEGGSKLWIFSHHLPITHPSAGSPLLVHHLSSSPPTHPLASFHKWPWLYPPSTPHLTRAAHLPHPSPKRARLWGVYVLAPHRLAPPWWHP